MDDAVTRATAIAAARSLLIRDGDKFTVASVCKESGLNRTRMRRAFPTKATLIAAVLNELLANREAVKTRRLRLQLPVTMMVLVMKACGPIQYPRGAIRKSTSMPQFPSRPRHRSMTTGSSVAFVSWSAQSRRWNRKWKRVAASNPNLLRYSDKRLRAPPIPRVSLQLLSLRH